MKTTKNQFALLCLLLMLAIIIHLEAYSHAFHQPRYWVANITLMITSVLVISAGIQKKDLL